MRSRVENVMMNGSKVAKSEKLKEKHNLKSVVIMDEKLENLEKLA